MTNKPQMTNMTAEQWDAIAEAVDALSGALSVVNPRLNIEPESTPEPDPWPTEPLIVATFLDKRCVFGRTEDGNYDSPTGGLEADSDFHRDALTNVVPVAPVPVAELDALRENMRAWDEGGFATLSTSARNLLAATDALGLDQ